MKKHRSLYICYFGIREPLVQTQVLPYLRELMREGDAACDSGSLRPLDLSISLLTFEAKHNLAAKAELSAIQASLADEGIRWHWLTYHKRPSVIATAWDVFCGVRAIRNQIHETTILHSRSHVPMLRAALARKFSRLKPKIIFDIRGFMPEEYADGGVWRPNGWMFRLAKRIEKWLMREADGFVVLTEKAKALLFADETKRPVEVIPCCVDLKTRFDNDREELRTEFRAKLDLNGRFVIVHVGSLGGLYLTNEIVALLARAREIDSNVFAMFLTQSDPALVEPQLRAKGLGSDFLVTKVAPENIAGYLCAADLGLSFVRSSYATQSRSPTKIPEYLACGLPIIANSGVGDVDDLILTAKVGALVNEMESDDYVRALNDIRDLGDISDRCRETARRGFDLETVGGVRYRRLYARLLDGVDR